MSVPAPVVERKIIGELMRAARERGHRSVKQVAQRFGVSAGRVRQYEAGKREASLPELEMLVLYLSPALVLCQSRFEYRRRDSHAAATRKNKIAPHDNR